MTHRRRRRCARCGRSVAVSANPASDALVAHKCPHRLPCVWPRRHEEGQACGDCLAELAQRRRFV